MIYKNKFIALYDDGENCVFVTDNWPELATYLGKTVSSLQSSLSCIFRENRKSKHIICDGKKLTPYLFDLEEE